MRKTVVAFIIVLFGVLAYQVIAPTPSTDVHTEIQQRLLEAEWGSATTVHFAAHSNPAPSNESFDSLLHKLGAVIPAQRWDAAEELARRRDPRAVDALIRALRDPTGTRRVCVMASALGKLGDPRALGALTEAAFDPDNRDLRLCAIRSLGMIGDRRAVPRLVEALEAGNAPVAAANTIARLGDTRGVAPIIHAAENPDLRLWMVLALGELGSRQALPYLKTLERDPQQVIREAAVESRWKIEQLAADQPAMALVSVLSGAFEPRHRMWAAFKLGERRETRAIPALVGALSDSQAGVRGRAAAALIRIGQPAAEAVRQQARTAVGPMATYAVAVLGYLGARRDIPLLAALETSEVAALEKTAGRSIVLIKEFSQPRSSTLENL